MNYKETLICLRAKEAREAKNLLFNEIKTVSNEINSCNSISELQELRKKALQILKRLEGLKNDLQSFGLWYFGDNGSLQMYFDFWAE